MVLLDEDTPKELLNEIQPNIHVKGGDYKESDLPESKIVQKYGGEIKIVKLVEGKSSTNTITKIMETQNE